MGKINKISSCFLQLYTYPNEVINIYIYVFIVSLQVLNTTDMVNIVFPSAQQVVSVHVTTLYATYTAAELFNASQASLNQQSVSRRSAHHHLFLTKAVPSQSQLAWKF